MTLATDVRYALRRLRQNPSFTAVVLLTLALGIGANTAVFSVVNALLLRPLPYARPQELVTINHFYRSAALNDLLAPVSAIGFRDYRDSSTSFASVAVEAGWAANLTGTGDPERIPGSRVSGDYFRTLGVTAEVGRPLLPAEDVPGQNKVVVLSDALWRRVFGADTAVVHHTVELNGESYQIVGVMPPDFRAPFNPRAELWAPLALPPTRPDVNTYTNEYLNLTARLKPGVTIERAAIDMTQLAARLRQLYPTVLAPVWTLKVTSLNDLATSGLRAPLLVLLGAVGFVVLIACANVANLFLARGAARIKDVAIRTALGADRGRLIRQSLTESITVAVIGGGAGIVLACWGVGWLVAAMPSLPRAETIRVDGTVLAVMLGVSVLTGVLFGIAPALGVGRLNLSSILKEGGRTGAADVAGRGTRRTLIVTEMALSLTLLMGAGLMIRSVGRLLAIQPGFDAHNLLTFNVALPRLKYDNDTVRTLFFDQVIPAVAAVPGVKGVATTTTLPFGGAWSTGSFGLSGVPIGPNNPPPWGDIRAVNSDFFQTMGVRVLSGRGFASTDRIDSRHVAVVDEELVKHYFHDQNPIGRFVLFGGAATPDSLAIVGVVSHTMHEGLDAKPRVQLYLPYTQLQGLNFMAFAVRTSGPPAAMTAAVRRAISSVDAAMPISAISDMETLVSQSLGQRRVSMILLGLFAAIAMVLAAIGIYGVMSYSVVQRTREIGVRMALGAHRATVLGHVMRDGMSLAALGIVVGALASLGLTRLLRTQLYGVEPTDLPTLALVVTILGATALAAVLVPGLRATRVDPVVALREE